MLHAIAKIGGLEFVIVDDFKNTNGEYITGKGVIVISRHTEGGLITRTAGHEVYHFLKDSNVAQATELADFVLQKLGGRDSTKVQKALQKYDPEIYKTAEAREDELVADSMFDVFTNEKTVRELTAQHTKLGRKLEARLGRILTGIRDQLRLMGSLKRSDGSYFKPEIAALMDDVEALEKIRTLMLEGLKAAGEQRAAMANGDTNAGAEKNTAGAVESRKDDQNHGNGYSGYSMSNNAVAAYEIGEKPLSKWSRSALIDAAREIDSEKAELLERVGANALRAHLLRYTGWHHTSSMYNRTDFYGIDEQVLKALTPETAADWAKEKKLRNLSRDIVAIWTIWNGMEAEPIRRRRSKR